MFIRSKTIQATSLILKVLLLKAILAVSSAQAYVVMDSVVVGDIGNLDDNTGHGAVDYEYHIGAHEVTNAQYAEFLNAVASTDTFNLWYSGMQSNGIDRSGTSGSYTYSATTGASNKPVAYVGFWSAARFANWMTNGQLSGSQDDTTTESGMYDLNSELNPNSPSITRQIDFSSGGSGVAIASLDEWYKAAYYNGADGTYYNYPTQSDTAPNASAPNDTDSNSANFDNAVGSVTDVGSYSLAQSYYGAFDMAGNLWEWNEGIYGPTERGIRGGSTGNASHALISSNDSKFEANGDYVESYIGFRITSDESLMVVPEPATISLVCGLSALGFVMWRRRRA
ncbi:SUMF1/EgtB/PvdO family nonheme iron enzyme [Rubellicoccus peritrichatus]|uniref:SUMF1/EgtB/PvdO family nonheme iron enzyme n=1 Tax=Rubellicoccus peritrichatus TaxID=3080537 RepID=A0AAQ3LEV9_9BACT|nr:SUMF1/EgtB/PvdO family nonheme iron enzyme [Puniceicoccus sp. CR14]WOO43447.1 SUMF1/EgtB/PvdO family nonheme iron enzyme [Puniceicoccus sp. CR14]